MSQAFNVFFIKLLHQQLETKTRLIALSCISSVHRIRFVAVDRSLSSFRPDRNSGLWFIATHARMKSDKPPIRQANLITK